MENEKIIIIDDDPTGCQTMHDVPIITSWDKETLVKITEQEDVFFIFSNSRSLSPQIAYKTIKEIALSLRSVQQDDMRFKIISRSDSTLRGHLKEELKAINEVFGPYDGTVVAPFFLEGNRITINDSHYIKDGESLIPVSETEFAKDPVLGYNSSHLPTYLQEKTHGFWQKDNFISIGTDEIRKGGINVVAEKLTHCANNIPVIVNSVTKSDFKTAVAGIKQAEKSGKKFLFRTGASFVSEYTGVTEKSLFMPEQPAHSCLIIVGSFVNRTTQQILHLEKNVPIANIQIKSKSVISERENYLYNVIQKIEDELLINKMVLVSTERDYMGKGSVSARIDFGKKLSAFICEMVAGIRIQPELIIAKGGITSHDVLKSGLGVQKSKVLGQVYPGVPILRLDDSGKFPGSFYVIFPGNVGNESTLTQIVKKFLTR